MATDLAEDRLEKLRLELIKEAADLCIPTENTPLPPLRIINHKIPIIDEFKVYSFRPFRCPEALKPQWRAKRDKYLQTGRWEYYVGNNAIPMLLINKNPGPNGELRLRTVFNERERNANTKKMTSPLPDQQAILMNVCRHWYRTLINCRDAYESSQVEPANVWKTLFNTPDRTMISNIMQISDCNAPATYQTLMNHLFSRYTGVFVYVYLDDIVIYSDSIKDHLKHCRIVNDILCREKLYLATADKLQFFASELKVLGHVVDDKGIVIDPYKVNKISRTNKPLLLQFIGAAGYLADNCPNLQLSSSLLSSFTGAPKVWRWGPTEQHTFENVKKTIHEYWNLHRVSINYNVDFKMSPVSLIVDACQTGGGGLITQLQDNRLQVIAFWSGKFNSAQQNYLVHERELLAIVESMKQYRHLLLGIPFNIYMDHKPIEYLMSQKNLSARQQRWVDVLSLFSFEIKYILGKTNDFADALSRIYRNEALGIVWAESEYIHEKDVLDVPVSLKIISKLLLTGNETMGEISLQLSVVTREPKRFWGGDKENGLLK